MRFLVVEADGRRLLDVDAFDVASGEFVCVTGPSGAGKSTLLGSLAGLRRVTGGSVRWRGGELDIDLATASARAAGRFRDLHVGLMFQDAMLFDELGTLANAALGGAWRRAADRSRIERRARELLTGLGLDPDDARAVAGRSGGERQRIGMARALATEPSILLADEPTASLDRAAAGAAIDVLRALADAGERTLVVVSHDAALQRAADRVVHVVDGRLASERNAA